MKNLILICGDEEYLKEQKKNELLNTLGASGSFNFNAFSGENADLDEIGRLIGTMPLFEDHRTILLSDTGWFHGAADEAVTDMLAGIPDSTFLIFYEKEADAGSRLTRFLKEKGEIFRYTSTDNKKGRDASAAKQEVRSWARDYLRGNGRKIDGRVLNDLAEMTGYDMQNLQTELEKLISYTAGRGPGALVTQEDVDSICSRTLNDRVFEMMSYKLTGRNQKAVELLEELFALRNPPLRILYIIVRQYTQAYTLKELQREGLTDAQIMDRMQIRDWLLRKLKDQTRNWSAEELHMRLEQCAVMETKVKNGDMPDRLAIEILMAQ